MIRPAEPLDAAALRRAAVSVLALKRRVHALGTAAEEPRRRLGNTDEELTRWVAGANGDFKAMSSGLHAASNSLSRYQTHLDRVETQLDALAKSLSVAAEQARRAAAAKHGRRR